MKKLTAEVARRNIHLLKEMQSASNIGLSMRSELFLQALEIALPILEQQERGDDWIEWGGGECPIKPGDICDIKCRDGEFFRRLEDYQLDWKHDGTPADIIAYRIIPEQSTNQTAQQSGTLTIEGTMPTNQNGEQ